MYRRLTAVAASLLFVLLLLFPSLGVESNNNFYEGVEKEIVESSGKVAMREAQETIEAGASGFVVVLIRRPVLRQSFCAVRDTHLSLAARSIFLRCCVLLI